MTFERIELFIICTQIEFWLYCFIYGLEPKTTSQQFSPIQIPSTARLSASFPGKSIHNPKLKSNSKIEQFVSARPQAIVMEMSLRRLFVDTNINKYFSVCAG